MPAMDVHQICLVTLLCINFTVILSLCFYVKIILMIITKLVTDYPCAKFEVKIHIYDNKLAVFINVFKNEPLDCVNTLNK